MNLARQLSVCAAWYDIASIRESWEYAPWFGDRSLLCWYKYPVSTTTKAGSC